MNPEIKCRKVAVTTQLCYDSVAKLMLAGRVNKRSYRATVGTFPFSRSAVVFFVHGDERGAAFRSVELPAVALINERFVQ